MRLTVPLLLSLLLALPAWAASQTIRLKPLPANPGQTTDTLSQSWARTHGAGGIDDDLALVYLPIAPGYVQAVALDGSMDIRDLPRLGPWTDAFLIRFNAYVYEDEKPVDKALDFSTDPVELRWGAPTSGDTATFPEPSQHLPLAKVGTAAGLWYLAAFPDVATAKAFEMDPLRQLRLTHKDRELVIELNVWDGLTLFSEPSHPPQVDAPKPAPEP